MMIRRRFPRLAAVLLLCLCALPLLRATTHEFSATPDSPSHIKVEQPFDYAPYYGYIPLRITITNPDEQTRTWVISNQTQKDNQYRRYSNEPNTDWRQSMSVPGGQMRTFDILYPTLNSSHWHNDRLFNIKDGSLTHEFRVESRRENSGRNTTQQTFGLASEKLRTRHEENIAAYLRDNSELFRSGNAKLNYLPTDWRAYAGVNILWFQQEDWENTPATERLPILQWVSQGGELRILKDEGTADSARVSGLPGSGKGLIPHGGGYVRVYPYMTDKELLQYAPGLQITDEFDEFAPRPRGRYRGAGQPPEERVHYSERTAQIYQELGSNFWTKPASINSLPEPSPEIKPLQILYFQLRPDALLVTLSVLIAAIVLGPVNLWVFARGRKRYRLLVTTPLLSVLLCLGIVTVIVLDDGIGGKGMYTRLFILSGDNQEVILTGQHSHTGLLPSREFELEEGSWLLPPQEADAFGGLEGNATYGQSNNTYWGNWFGSRRVQNQLLVQIRPSRSGFEIREQDGKLYVLSSFPATSPVLYVTNADATACYIAKDVVTGRPAALQPASMEQFRQWVADTHKLLGSATTQKVSTIDIQPSTVYASVENHTDTNPTASPSSIKWTNYTSMVIAPASGTIIKQTEAAQ